MNSFLRLRVTAFYSAVFVFTCSIHAQLAPAKSEPSTKKSDEDTLHLSVFEVNSSNDIGYQSLNAAQATRMNTPIEASNFPFAIWTIGRSVVTRQAFSSVSAIAELRCSIMTIPALERSQAKRDFSRECKRPLTRIRPRRLSIIVTTLIP